MNRLWVRLSFSFSGILMTGVIIIFALVMINNRPQLIRDLVERSLLADDGLVEQLADAFAEDHNWDQAITLIQTEVEKYDENGVQLTLTLFSVNGDRLYHSNPRIPVEFVKDKSYPIIVDNHIRAYLLLDLPEPPQAPSDSEFDNVAIQQFQRMLLIVVTSGALVSIIAGSIVSRRLTVPLQNLADAARLIRDKKSYHKVNVDESSIEIKEVSQAFNEMVEALSHAEQLRRNLVADVAHELRTPLTVLQGNLYALLDDVYPMDKEQILRVYDQTRILSRLVSDLHELSQAEANQLTLERMPTDIYLMVNDTAVTFEPVTLAKGITLVIDVPENLPILNIDPIRIEQVLNNLINNAIIHTPEDGTITVKAFKRGENLKIQVKDTGKGIPQDQLNDIFERFYRVDPNRTRVQGGTGLGLAIVKAIVTLHGGTIEAFSTGIAGEGAVFTVTLPLQT